MIATVSQSTIGVNSGLRCGEVDHIFKPVSARTATRSGPRRHSAPCPSRHSGVPEWIAGASLGTTAGFSRLFAIFPFRDQRCGGFLCARQPVYCSLENGNCVTSFAWRHCLQINIELQSTVIFMDDVTAFAEIIVKIGCPLCATHARQQKGSFIRSPRR